MPNRRLEDRIRELCARVIREKDPQQSTLESQRYSLRGDMVKYLCDPGDTRAGVAHGAS